MNVIYQRSFSRQIEQLVSIRGDLAILLKRFRVIEKTINDTQLVVTEYVSNLLRHITSHDDIIKLSVANRENQLVITIHDSSPLYQPLSELLDSSEEQMVIADESGMGLHIINQLISHAQYSELDDGCEFSFSIPLNITQQQIILVVDDDPVILALVTEYLSDKYEVISCSSVQQAMNTLLEYKPTLIISDIKMPDCDGIDFKKQLAENVVLNRIPFVYLTGVENESTKDYAITHGIDDYITKPVSKQTLLSHIERIICRDQQRLIADKKISGQIQETRMRSRLPTATDDVSVTFQQYTAEEMSGDFVLHHQAEDGDYFILGDVMGHGIDAAFYSYSFSGYIRAFLNVSKINSLNELMTSISDAVYKDNLLEDQLMTMLLIKTSEKGIEIISAGHPKPILINDEHVTVCDVSGPLLGLFSGQEFTKYSIEKAKNSSLFCYTDGLTDSTSELADVNTLVSSLTQTLESINDPEQLIKQLMLQLPSPELRPVNDDISCLMLHQI